MKHLYLNQQKIPLSKMSDEEKANIATDWPLRWQVTKVIGAVQPRVLSYLTEGQVQIYCNDEEWQVEIT